MNAGLSHPLGIESASGADGDTSTVRPTPRDAAHLAAAGDAVASVGGDGLPGVPSDEPWNEIDYDSDPEPIEGDTAEARAAINEHLRCIAWWEADLGKSAALYDETRRKLTEQLRQLEEWSKSEQKRVNRHVAYHAQPVRGYLAARIRHEPRLRSVSLPFGTLKATVPQTPRLKIEDQKALDAWVMANHADLFKEPKDIGVTAVGTVTQIKKVDGGYMVVDENGEIVPGITADLPAATYDYVTNDMNEPF